MYHLCVKAQEEVLTDLTYIAPATISLPQAGDQEANHNEAEDQQSGHDQSQECHVARTVADV